MALSCTLRFVFILVILFVGSHAFAVERDVKVENARDGITLAGTLAMPDSRSPRALLVLASGSGAQNRDEEVFGLKPFKVLSDTLVAEGYGVLRMDDRGVGDSEGVFETAVLDDFTSDAVAGVEYLHRLYPETKVGILGHSQGGQVAVKAAADGNADFIVTLAGPVWKGDSIIMAQCRALSVAATGSWEGEQIERRLLDIAMSDMPDYVAKTLLYGELAKTVEAQAGIPQVQQQIYAQIEPLVIPMYRELLRYDPAKDVKAVNVPWIALNGDKDLQVPVDNLKTINELNPSAQTFVLKSHNHLFQPAVSGLPTEYPTRGQSPSDETLSVIISELNKLF